MKLLKKNTVVAVYMLLFAFDINSTSFEKADICRLISCDSISTILFKVRYIGFKDPSHTIYCKDTILPISFAMDLNKSIKISKDISSIPLIGDGIDDRAIFSLLSHNNDTLAVFYIKNYEGSSRNIWYLSVDSKHFKIKIDSNLKRRIWAIINSFVDNIQKGHLKSIIGKQEN